MSINGLEASGYTDNSCCLFATGGPLLKTSQTLEREVLCNNQNQILQMIVKRASRKSGASSTAQGAEAFIHGSARQKSESIKLSNSNSRVSGSSSIIRAMTG